MITIYTANVRLLTSPLHTHPLSFSPNKLVQAWREQDGSTSKIDSIAKAVVFYAGDQCWDHQFHGKYEGSPI